MFLLKKYKINTSFFSIGSTNYRLTNAKNIEQTQSAFLGEKIIYLTLFLSD